MGALVGLAGSMGALVGTGTGLTGASVGLAGSTGALVGPRGSTGALVGDGPLVTGATGALVGVLTVAVPKEMSPRAPLVALSPTVAHSAASTAARPIVTGRGLAGAAVQAARACRARCGQHAPASRRPRHRGERVPGTVPANMLHRTANSRSRQTILVSPPHAARATGYEWHACAHVAAHTLTALFALGARYRVFAAHTPWLRASCPPYAVWLAAFARNDPAAALGGGQSTRSAGLLFPTARARHGERWDGAAHWRRAARAVWRRTPGALLVLIGNVETTGHAKRTSLSIDDVVSVQ